MRSIQAADKLRGITEMTLRKGCAHFAKGILVALCLPLIGCVQREGDDVRHNSLSHKSTLNGLSMVVANPRWEDSRIRFELHLKWEDGDSHVGLWVLNPTEPVSIIVASGGVRGREIIRMINLRGDFLNGKTAECIVAVECGEEGIGKISSIDVALGRSGLSVECPIVESRMVLKP